MDANLTRRGMLRALVGGLIGPWLAAFSGRPRGSVVPHAPVVPLPGAVSPSSGGCNGTVVCTDPLGFQTVSSYDAAGNLVGSLTAPPDSRGPQVQSRRNVGDGVPNRGPAKLNVP
jgi:hypothetical protein